ncbi:MAG: mycothione reductase [Acidimicrobiales bacterium]
MTDTNATADDTAADTVEHTDLIIIGSGSGNSIPEYLSDKQIVLIEKGTFGGTCLNVGCIPSKMFVLPADFAVAGHEAAKVNVDLTLNSADFEAIRDRVFGLIDPITAGGENYRATGTPNVDYIKGTARFVGPKTVRVNGRTISADNVMVAVGSRPNAPQIPGLDSVRYHTSDTIMRLEKLPARLGILGGGFIAVEMGHVFSGLGSHVTMFNRSDRLLGVQDAEISDRFTKQFQRRATMRLGCIPDRIEQDGDTIVVHCGAETFEFDELLVATGRISNADLVDAERGGLTLDGNRRITVDEHMETVVPGVYAIGDVANNYQLKHVANAEAKVAFWNIAHPDQRRTIDYRAVPAAVFSHPQVASVGLTEEDAIAENVPYVVGKRDYGGTAYGWALNDSESFAKVLVNPLTGLILGCHIIGPQAATLIQPVIQAMQFSQTAQAVAEQVFYIHPALTEVVENALLAAVEAIREYE